MSKTITTKIDPKWRVGVVTSRFNEDVTGRLQSGALAQLKKYNLKPENLVSVWVPGAFEIPLAAKWLIDYEKCDGVIALGAVIRGETSHYDFVCSAVERGCTHLQLETGRPVVFGVLTTDNDEQALNRAGGAQGHKGEEAVDTLFEMLLLKKCLNPPKKKERRHDRK
jgi:6,7-dimethyl-8-ribityllumazine synthase